MVLGVPIFKHFRVITFKNGISFEEKVYNKQIINTVTWYDALCHACGYF